MPFPLLAALPQAFSLAETALNLGSAALKGPKKESEDGAGELL
ncbi:hypothetical protein [Massilia sp. YMA4]|uniref:Uncharacterized protein n=1 Tax=[Empedobacter] haloabium TaxID=592317 RepID=A0ABZ1UM61_9BURK|nr:hypothetical protein [Massilia sp. YMA4]